MIVVNLADIWNDFDNHKKEAVIKPVDNYRICSNCDVSKVINSEGFPTCPSCAVTDKYFIDESAEWTGGITEDGKSNDPSRCQMPTDSELFSDNWGKSTIISTTNYSTYEQKRMSKINFHNSMNHKDRTLFHAYNEIDEACECLPKNVVMEAKMLYREFNEEKLTRGAVRAGIKANCVLYACKNANLSRTTKEIADLFKINCKDISRTSQIFTEAINNVKTKSTKPFDVIVRLLNYFEVSKEERLRCINICNQIEKCTELMAKTPTSVASSIIYTVLSHKYTKTEICKKCDVSAPTMNKIIVIIKKYLEGK